MPTGIIPARAGFTGRPAWRPGPKPDHPRSRGVYGNMRAGMESHGGSSPLARGLQPLVTTTAISSGIIPARAGFTRGLTWRWLVGVRGSSPLARGLLHIHPSGGPVLRIIPARAGFTDGPQGHDQADGDHPRSRGVYWSSSPPRASDIGSSPLARGLHLWIPGIPTTSHTTRPRLPSLPT